MLSGSTGGQEDGGKFAGKVRGSAQVGSKGRV